MCIYSHFSNLWGGIHLLLPFYGWGNWGLERLGSLVKVTLEPRSGPDSIAPGHNHCLGLLRESSASDKLRHKGACYWKWWSLRSLQQRCSEDVPIHEWWHLGSGYPVWRRAGVPFLGSHDPSHPCLGSGIEPAISEEEAGGGHSGFAIIIPSLPTKWRQVFTGA